MTTSSPNNHRLSLNIIYIYIYKGGIKAIILSPKNTDALEFHKISLMPLLLISENANNFLIS